jgi:hypothetical protein
MVVTKQELKKYFRLIKKELNCSFYQKNIFINELKHNIYDYIDDNPDAELSDIIDNFGDSKEISKGFSIMDNKKIIWKARIQMGIIIILTIILIFVVCVAIEAIHSSGGLIVDVID